MITKEELYKGFNGYNAYKLQEAEKIVRSRFNDMCAELLDLVNSCYEKSKKTGRLKAQADIEPVRKRIMRLKKEIEERDMVYVPPFIKEGISGIDEKSLMTIDYAIAEIFNTCFARVNELSCDEQYMDIVKRFNDINTMLRELEQKCHARMQLLRKDSAG